jgi:mRNA-degrading endonuclease RelE of RelBE toxin-antitoxin system
MAVRQFKRLPRAVRPLLRDAMRRHLVDADPTETTRNKFRLRRVSQHADFELRVEEWRIFYRVEPDAVVVTLFGEKRGNRLIVGGEEFKL